jgi:gas vesicle structural protein
MPVERTVGGTSLIDVLDRVLDKGIVIDAWVRVSLVGIDLITVEARIVVASIDTYLKYSEAVGQVGSVSKPGGALEPTRASDIVLAENAELRRQLAASEGGGKRLRRQLAASEASAKPRRARAAARRRG